MEGTRTRRSLGAIVGVLTLGMALLLALGMSAARAETGMKALILESTVTGGAASLEATNATGNGFAVTLVDDTTWASMTAAEFSDYQLIIVGDPTCGTLPEAVSANAAALADAVMARSGSNTKVGNRVLIGTDPVYHQSQGGAKLIETAIDFAGVQEGASGLYLSFTCFDYDYDGDGTPDGQEKLLPLLTAQPGGTWTQNQSPPCGGDVALISNAAQFSSLTSTDLRGWGCSVHETFPTFPTDWTALAVATDVPTAPTCGTDVTSGEAKCGEAYILISGSGIVVEAPNLSLDPTTATNPVNTSHTVTATVTNTDGTPRSGVVVSWIVTGANAGAAGVCVPASCTTGADGKVTFTYTGTNVGDDTINAAITVDGARQTATAAKKWETGTTPTPSLSLDPPTGTNPVGTQHTVTATVASSGSPLSGVVVSWSVTGANAGATGSCVPASCATGADGKVAFTYTGATAGDDTINAAITVSGTQVTATAAKKWEAPPPSECDVEGKGTIQTGKAFGKVDFRVDVTETGGSFFLQTTAHRNKFNATSIERCSQDGDTVSFSGSGTWNGAAATYEVTFVDKGFPGRNDTIDVVIISGGSTVFSSVGPKLLENGNITVTEV